ncbi:MAG: ABC transporter ATP-binding protein [Bacteroidia bacterium]|nr:MAG: ABC transporter ATP-binding protein [Bacteroidia bacterium]
MKEKQDCLTEDVIVCDHLTHYYGKRCIYEDLSFRIPKGRILGLLGKNGTGKTTTINILNGYLQPRSGNCSIFGEPSHNLSPAVRQRVGLLIEGHVQYSFMNVKQLERFYARFYPHWKRDTYFELISHLKIDERQRISRMSCGQRSQVALGLILAQNPDLLILDDFSMGLDPGYRRLFVDYLNEYARSNDKTVFVTSHIIQDMERLIDDCLIMDYGRILLQKPVKEILDTFSRYTMRGLAAFPKEGIEGFYHPDKIKDSIEFYSFLPLKEVREKLEQKQIKTDTLRQEKVTLEEAFIGLTGKY